MRREATRAQQSAADCTHCQTEFIENDERGLRGSIEYDTRLEQLDLEGRLPHHDAIARADASEDAIDSSQRHRFGGNPAPDLSQDHRTAGLTQNSRLNEHTSDRQTKRDE